MKILALFLLLFCAGCSSVSDEAQSDPESIPLPEETNTASVVAEEGILEEVIEEPELESAPLQTNFPPDTVAPLSEPAKAVKPELPTFVIEEFAINKDLAMGSVLRALARIADVNIAFSDSVEDLGPLRFRLNHPTPWNEVFESILDVYHLSYDLRGKIITVMTLDDMTQKYDLEKQKSDQLDLQMHQAAMTPLILEVVPVKYIKADTVVDPLQKLLKQSSLEEGGNVRGSVSVDLANNNVVLHAPAAEMETLLSLLNRMDRQSRQVRIEASLVEVSSQFDLELGVKWSIHANDSLQDPDSTRGSSSLSPMSMDEEGNFTLPGTTYRSMQGLIDSAAGTVDYGIIGRDFALGMNLKALEEDGKIKILSRPSLTTMDNQKAIIKSGSDVPFQTEDENGRAVVEYKEAVLSLDVLPQIVDDIAIYLDVSITKDEPDFSQSVNGNPLVLRKYVQTRMMVLDGQTAVIAGLTKNSRTNRDGGIPFLRNIPLLGRLFSSKLKQDSDEELMIFLTPRIIPSTALDQSNVVEEWMMQNYNEAP